jgi:hypothetical protein
MIKVTNRGEPRTVSPRRKHPLRLDLLRAPLIGAFLRWRHSRLIAQLLLLAVAVVMTLHGLLVPTLAAKNLATLLTWALMVDSLFKHASFCKFVCPIGQFNFVASTLSPLEVKVLEPETCSACATKDCASRRVPGPIAVRRILGVPLIAWTLWLHRHSLAGLRHGHARTSTGVRMVLLLLVIVALAGPTLSFPARTLAVYFLGTAGDSPTAAPAPVAGSENTGSLGERLREAKRRARGRIGGTDHYSHTGERSDDS